MFRSNQARAICCRCYYSIQVYYEVNPGKIQKRAKEGEIQAIQVLLQSELEIRLGKISRFFCKADFGILKIRTYFQS